MESLEMREILNGNYICAIMRNVPDEKALSYARAAYEGGVRLFEVAMNTPGGAKQIVLLKKGLPQDARIGAGTVIDEKRCVQAQEAGAEFFLTPNVARVTLEYCRKHHMPLLPGVFTPTDVGICLDYGYDVMKLFPAGDMPLSYIKSLKGPFDGTEYVAVGGVNLQNIADFEKAGFIGAGIGSNLIPKDLVNTGDWDGAAAYVRRFYEQINRLH